MTIPEIRAARALLDWTQSDLSERSGIALRTLRRIELGEAALTDEYREKLERVFRQSGIEFLSKEPSREGVGRRV